MKIIQLVANHISAPGGMEHYTLGLAKKLREDHQIFTDFFCYCELENMEKDKTKVVIDGFSSINIYYANSSDILSLFSSALTEGVDGIVLHYTPLASWLLGYLQSLRKNYKFKLLVVFHDCLYVPSLIKDKISYKIRYFLGNDKSPNLMASKFAKIADHVLTFSGKYKSIISQWVRHPVACIPVYSTIGEPRPIPPLNKRTRRMVVFGKPYRRKRVYQEAIQALIESCHNLGIQEIYDIGRSREREHEVNIPDLPEVKILVMGEQPPEQISQVMLTSLAGFIYYDPAYLGKSTIFAALCAHGVIPIFSKSTTSVADGVEANKHYLVPNNYMKNVNEMELQSISDSVYRWYGNHSLEKTVEIYASLLRK
ncbi:MAG: hypothetical protein RH949_26165 [Coleofasciculus sp. A1-SPW-01]|uniref:hypothetical protein n=1 Tax=Coleofasciculus sp. A1-SPW-01 TaxID=3070819 RepID=UPI0033003BE6